ncbi:MAG: substrate-binding domain-containing protein [Campylobacterota bacterium]
MRSFILLLFGAFFLQTFLFAASDTKKITYIVSDSSIPFWQILEKGVRTKAKDLGYEISVCNSGNSLKTELQCTIKATNDGTDAIVISPINSSSSVTVLDFAQKADIPVVIADIGTEKGEYLSYISSDNYAGAYALGKILTAKMQELHIEDAGVGIIAIPQKRANGKERTEGFMQALREADIKGVGIKQQVDFSLEETYNHAKDLIANNPQMKALWLQGSDKYKGALQAIKDAGKEGEILLICFDAEPEFLDMIPKGTLVGAAMQQPFLMGEKAIEIIDNHFDDKEVQKNIKLPILAISEKNIKQKLPTIKQNVLGIHE